jgi:hypothetical protein
LKFLNYQVSRNNLSHLENITNSRKDLVGKAKLSMTDHVSPSSGMGGKNSKSCLMPYILLRASEKANLQPPTIKRWNQLKKLSGERSEIFKISIINLEINKHGSYLQFPAFIASQNDQKSLCKSFLGSMSMRTQK